MRWARTCVVTLTVAASTSWLCSTSVALNTPDDPGPSRHEPLPSDLGSPAELESAIRELSQPIDPEKLSKVFVDLSRIEDRQEQERLQALLDERMHALTELSTRPSESPLSRVTAQAQPALEPTVSGEELRLRIEMLNLGPDATADDLRVRDQLVSQIAGIRDPLVRDELLAKLEEKERQWQEVIEQP